MQLAIMGGPIEMTDTQKGNCLKLERPVVSMCCLTYNHVDTIAQCLDGMLMQKVEVPFEIVVHDDASTDGTAEIVADYAARHPGRIRTILQTKNQYSYGPHPIALLFEAARGDFIAICEGDDFWTDECKIKIQWQALESHPSIDICAHASQTWISSADSGPKKMRPFSYPEGIYSAADLLLKERIKVQTATLFFRSHVVGSYVRFMRARKRNVGDVYLKALCARRGGLLYLAREMSVYRLASLGSWSGSIRSDYLARSTSATSKIIGLSDLRYQLGSPVDHAIRTVSARTILWVLRDHHMPFIQKIIFLVHNARYLSPRALWKVSIRRFFRGGA